MHLEHIVAANRMSPGSIIRKQKLLPALGDDHISCSNFIKKKSIFLSFPRRVSAATALKSGIFTLEYFRLKIFEKIKLDTGSGLHVHETHNRSVQKENNTEYRSGSYRKGKLSSIQT